MVVEFQSLCGVLKQMKKTWTAVWELLVGVVGGAV